MQTTKREQLSNFRRGDMLVLEQFGQHYEPVQIADITEDRWGMHLIVLRMSGEFAQVESVSEKPGIGWHPLEGHPWAKIAMEQWNNRK